MRYHGINYEVITIYADSKASKQYLWTTGDNLFTTVHPSTETPGAPIQDADFDPRLDDYVSDEEKRAEKPIPLEARIKFERPKPYENPAKTVKIGANLPQRVQEALIRCLKVNTDVFATTPGEMLGIDPTAACHYLNVNPDAKYVAQRRQRQSTEKTEAAKTIVDGLIQAKFISEIHYTKWLSTVVLVKKASGKWRMCVDYADLNKACPKDSYPLPNIDKLVDNSAGYKLLSFMDACSRYNQIPKYEGDKDKTTFMMDGANYKYNVMPFGLKNAGATYQRMMNKVFKEEIVGTKCVYINTL
ncbi:hypothetical protein A2U01_0017261 [Trifolium medium]|uniref:Reverse transcriptase domain-containing protein n=1 Tax=Trifolium medium TaxID=97028 RepID=A0A392N8Y7_9FABA|nr:hypothetical protein [Trifolium medium]